ncbi:diguanylate cyclase [Pseudarthrobacter sp. NPDC058196]|uniref:diguanylate cyclase n=1 Tax=Pseudarthrobacter sp. NPDC058196 TaxID=3346376 RepID=UPI0036D93529
MADDDPGPLMVAQAAVERSGHNCLTPSDGDEAWGPVSGTPAGRSGHGVDDARPGRFSTVQRHTGTDHDLYTYIMALTSQGSRDDVLSGLDAGADDYVTKALNPFVLHTRLLVAQRVTTLHADLARYRTMLSHQVRTDALTGLNNRLKLTEVLEQLHERSLRYGEEHCLAMRDVDNFKSSNDIYGHQAGDLPCRPLLPPSPQSREPATACTGTVARNSCSSCQRNRHKEPRKCWKRHFTRSRR